MTIILVVFRAELFQDTVKHLEMTISSESSPLPVIETVPLGDHLPKSEQIVYTRNPLIDGIIDFTGGTMGK